MRKMRSTLLFLTASLSLAFWTVTAFAQDPSAGRKTAAQVCSACHSIGMRGRSPNPKAPPFRAVAQLPSTTETSLAVFLTTSHEPMPNFVLSREEIRDLTAYILSLRRHNGRTVHQRYE